MDCKQAGDAVFIVGSTARELGASEYLVSQGVEGGRVARLDRERSKAVLTAVSQCIAAGHVNAAHDCSDGGLAVCLAEMAFAGGLGITADKFGSDRWLN